jgi:hypothetical protein
VHYAASTPKATIPKSQAYNKAAAAAFKSPTTLCFERMLSAGTSDDSYTLYLF